MQRIPGKCFDCGKPTDGIRFLCNSCWELYQFSKRLAKKFQEK